MRLSLVPVSSVARATQIKTYSWDNAQVLLVGNKCDMDDERVVSGDRARQLSDHLGELPRTHARTHTHRHTTHSNIHTYTHTEIKTPSVDLIGYTL